MVDAMPDPYLVEPPFSVSFSGGSTSGFMLRKILDAHGGSLPMDARVCFANTGMEHPKTLEFVHRVATEWGVDVVWLEYDPTVKRHFRVVDYESASRDGEPFETMINYRDEGALYCWVLGISGLEALGLSGWLACGRASSCCGDQAGPGGRDDCVPDARGGSYAWGCGAFLGRDAVEVGDPPVAGQLRRVFFEVPWQAGDDRRAPP